MEGELSYYHENNNSSHTITISDDTDDLLETIAAATTYEFSLKLVADTMETFLDNGIYEKTEMESHSVSVKCYTKPEVTTGTYDFSCLPFCINWDL